ncbi:hypothetical protein M9458_031820, partial [Cirrhinus mrigala]
PRSMDTRPRAAVGRMGNKGIRPIRCGRVRLPCPGWKSALQNDQGGHDASHFRIQYRHPALPSKLPPG